MDGGAILVAIFGVDGVNRLLEVIFLDVAGGNYLAVSKPRKDFVLAGPIMPHPMTPTVMRSCAGTRRARANGAAEKAAVAAADWMNFRRVRTEADEDEVIRTPGDGFSNAGRMITQRMVAGNLSFPPDFMMTI